MPETIQSFQPLKRENVVGDIIEAFKQAIIQQVICINGFYCAIFEPVPLNLEAGNHSSRLDRVNPYLITETARITL